MDQAHRPPPLFSSRTQQEEVSWAFGCQHRNKLQCQAPSHSTTGIPESQSSPRYLLAATGTNFSARLLPTVLLGLQHPCLSQVLGLQSREAIPEQHYFAACYQFTNEVTCLLLPSFFQSRQVALGIIISLYVLLHFQYLNLLTTDSFPFFSLCFLGREIHTGTAWKNCLKLYLHIMVADTHYGYYFSVISLITPLSHLSGKMLRRYNGLTLNTEKCPWILQR